MILMGRTEELKRKAHHSATLSTTNPTWTDPGTNLGLHDERLATNSLSHDKAIYKHLGIPSIHNAKAIETGFRTIKFCNGLIQYLTAL
jgi:hypothetical protein